MNRIRSSSLLDWCNGLALALNGTASLLSLIDLQRAAWPLLVSLALFFSSLAILRDQTLHR